MKITLIFILVFFSGLTVFSQKIELNSAVNNTKKSVIKNIDENNFEIYIPLKYVEINDNNSKNGNFIDLKNQKLVRSFDIGNPNLPVFSKLIEVPQGAKVVVSVLSYDEEIIDLKKNGFINKIFPAQPSLSKSINPDDEPFQINKNTYNTDAFYGKDNLATYENIGQMRAQRIGRVQINPFKYNPVSNILKVYNNIVLKVTFVDADWTKTEILRQKYDSPFFSTQDKSIIIQPENTTKELIQSAPVTYVIVSDPAFKTALAPFVEWKRQKGFYVIEAYTDDISVGTTVSSIKNYLENLYNNPATGVNPPSFILLVGDVDKIPATRHYDVDDSPWSDLDYAEYTGDYLPEVYYGRFSADNSTQVSDIVYKTIRYEKYQMADPSYLKQTLLVAGDDETNEDTYGGGAIWYADNYYLNSANGINSHTFLQKTIETWGGNYNGNSNAHDSIVDNINNGVALANYTAHCSPDGWATPSLSQSDLSNFITNTDKYGIWIGNCCQSNKFDEDEAFGEMALRKPNAGVIGYIGGSQFTYWDEDYYWGVGYASVVEEPSYNSSGLGTYDGMFHNLANEANDISRWYITSDQLIMSGNLAVQESGSTLAPYYWVIYHLMGDPSLMPYVGIPEPLDISINQQEIIIGTTNMTSTILPYAYVAFNQNDQLIGAGQADGNGILSIDFSTPITGDNLEIVGTAQFHQPYFNSFLPIATNQPYVITESMEASDVTNGASGTLTVNIKNYGETGFDATNVHVYIYSDDTLISIIDSTADISTVGSKETVILQDSFSYSLNYNIADQDLLPINIRITDENNTVTYTTKYLTINSPSFTSLYTSIDDTPDTLSIVSIPKETVAYGQNYTYNISVVYPFDDQQLNSGEEVVLTLKTSNTGHAKITDLYAQLTSSTPNVTIQHPVILYDTLDIDNYLLTDYTIHVDKLNSDVYYADFEYVFGDTIYQDTLTFSLPVNLISEDFETGDLSKFGWHISGDANWSVENDIAYEGKFSAKSGAITNNQQTNLNIYLNDVKSGQELSFYYFVSSEKNYDFLQFYVNDSKINEWSGNSGWQKYTYTFTDDGIYNIKFVYSKDDSYDENNDCAWIDKISFPVIPVILSKSAPITITAPIYPHWLDFVDNGDGTAVLSGTAPSEDYNDTIRIEATDGTLSTIQEYILSVQVTPIFDSNNLLKIYPNPTSNYLNIQIQESFNYSSLVLTDLNGRTMMQQLLKNTDNIIDISNMEKGIYFLKISVDDKLNYYKIIIE